MEKTDVMKAYNSGKMVQFKWWVSTNPTPRGSGNHDWGVCAYATFQKTPTEKKNWTAYIDDNWRRYYDERTFEQVMEHYPNEVMKGVDVGYF